MKNIFIKISSTFLCRKLFKFLENWGTKMLGVLSIIKLHVHIKKAHPTSSCRWSTMIKYGENISLGKNSRIGPKCVLGAKGGITIGENIVISREVQLETAGLDLTIGPPFTKHLAKPIVIEDNCWLGSSVIVLGGVTIGQNSIIGAGAVISKNVPPNSIIVGASVRNLKSKNV